MNHKVEVKKCYDSIHLCVTLSALSNSEHVKCEWKPITFDRLDQNIRSVLQTIKI